MSANTKIEWADHTFNPWTGCTKVSPACDHCYAEGWAKRSGHVQWGPDAERRRTSEANWKQPIKWNAEAARLGIRYRVFCASLADVFDNQVPPAWRADLLELIRATPHLDWLLLTKRIGNAHAMLDEAVFSLCRAATCDPVEWGAMAPKSRSWPNVWLGATICNQEEADRDIQKLLDVPAAKRFLSMEPLLGPVSFEGMFANPGNPADGTNMLEMLDWVIVGGESGPGARPMHPDWARSLRDQCQATGVPFFFKQWGEWLPTSGADFCRSKTRPEHAAFRSMHGRGGYEHAGKEGLTMLRDGRICSTDPAGDVWHRGRGTVIDEAALDSFLSYARTGCDDPGYQWFYRIVKKPAGRLLDGREWNEVPA